MANQTFTHIQLTTRNGKTRVRFTNEGPSREITLGKAGHDDITTVELPSEMEKGAAVTHLLTLKADFSKVDQIAIDEANDRYNTVVVKKSKAKITTKKAKAKKASKVSKASKLKEIADRQTKTAVKA